MKILYLTFLILIFTISSTLGCTIGVFSPAATTDGRPMLWKNRDVPNPNQQYIYVEAEHNFIGITYQGVSNKVYGGVNDVGFGIVNTDTYNQGGGRPTGLSDGEVMFLALSSCETVWDFMALLDSLLADTSAGLRNTHCYGVIDIDGNAVVVEATCTSYVYYSAASAPSGLLIRTNFAISGDDSDRRGWDRYLRARNILEPIVPVSYLDALSASRDLVTFDLDPNPLPFEGTFDGLPYGYISTENTINRYYTASYQVIIGANYWDSGIYPVMWSGFGLPYATIPIPLWVSSCGIPPQMTGAGASLCDNAQFIKGRIHDQPNITYFNTIVAHRVHEFLEPTETSVLHQYEERIGMWLKSGVNVDTLLATQQSLCNLVSERYEELRGLFIIEKQADRPLNMSITPHPNPFNTSLTIDVKSPSSLPVQILISDISGKIVVRADVAPDNNVYIWQPQDNVPSGIYLITAISGQYCATSRAILAR